MAESKRNFQEEVNYIILAASHLSKYAINPIHIIYRQAHIPILYSSRLIESESTYSFFKSME